VRTTVDFRPEHGTPPDRRLLRWRDCEFGNLRSVEETIDFPVIRIGFPTLDDFMDRAQTVLQRSKARSGRSLDLHTKEILIEERVREGVDFEHGRSRSPVSGLISCSPRRPHFFSNAA